jgi:two-component system response regulator NreC
MKAKKTIKVIVADDHAIVRRGLVSLLSLNKSYEVIGEAADGRTAIDQAFEKDPDVILMDINMPKIDGLEATEEIKTHAPRIKILVLSGHDNPEYVFKILESGANGYLLKTTTPEELFAAIDAVMAGNAFFSPSISKILLEKYLISVQSVPEDRKYDQTQKPYQGPLSKREQEILRYIAEGKTHQRIADLLHLSIRTVDTHCNNIIKKTNLHDTASLVTYALKNGLIKLP